MIITPFSQYYLNDVAEMETQCFSDPWTRDMFIDELYNPLSYCVVAAQAARAAGFAAMYAAGGEGYITNVMVRPDARRQGLGRALVQALLDHAAQSCLSSLTLEVRAGNTAAIALYRSLGFVPRGVRRNMYEHPPEDGVVMVLERL